MADSDSPRDIPSVKKNSSSIVDNEVQKLLKKYNGTLPQDIINELRRKYNDEAIVDQIQYGLMEEYNEIFHKAEKFAKYVERTFKDQNYPVNKLLKQAYKYKQKENLSDAVFDKFFQIYKEHLLGDPSNLEYSTQIVAPATNMSKVLGKITMGSTEGSHLEGKDIEEYKEIEKMYVETKQLHSQLILQSITYKDLDYSALTGEFKKDKHNANFSISPVIAALFLPKIPILDEHMLIASIPYIVHARQNHQQLMTKPDNELFYDLISDPNDIVCYGDSPMRDLRKRSDIQHHLWNNVLRLRQGQYYDASVADFIVAIDQCKFSQSDDPDLMYTNDEGTVLRRLLQSFSFRPIIVATTPLMNVVSTGYTRAVVTPPIINTLNMVTLRVPYSQAGTEVVHLEDYINQNQWYVEDGAMIPKLQQIIYAKGVLIFYVNRRFNTIDISRLKNPFSFNRLPLTVSGFERINEKKVNFNYDFDINGTTFRLKSVVCAETNPAMPELITHSSTLLRYFGDPSAGFIENRFYWYNPKAAGQAIQTGAGYAYNKPVTVIPGGHSVSEYTPETFYDKACKRGTIYIYVSSNFEQGSIIPEQSLVMQY